MTKLSDAQLDALIRDVTSWAPDADPDVVSEAVHRAWGIMDADPYGIAPIAFIGALLRSGLTGEELGAILRITEHLVASMADWNVVDDVGEGTDGRFDA